MIRSAPGVVVARLGDLPSAPTTGPADADWKPVGHFAGVTAFGVNAFLARAAGERLVQGHDESGSGQEEVYFLARGRARFAAGAGDYELEAPAFVVITDPAVARAAVASSDDALLLVVGRAPAGSFESTWDERHTRGCRATPTHETCFQAAKVA